MTKVAIFDTETTGFDPKTEQVIESAYIELVDLPPSHLGVIDIASCDTNMRRYRPDVPIQFGAQAVHHILAEDLEGCPHPSTLSLPVDLDYIIGHNIDFDCSHIGNPDFKRICTLAISRYMFPDLDSHNQSAMLYYIARLYGIESVVREALKNAHCAGDDVINCARLLRFLVKEALANGMLKEDSWEALYEFSELARIPTVMGFGKHKGDKIRDVPRSYVQWYRRQDETDPYYIKAFNMAGL